MSIFRAFKASKAFRGSVWSFAAILILCLAICPAAAGQADPSHPLLGQPVRDFTVTTVDGSTFTLSEVLKEKDAVLINLWATWCGPCEREFPYLEEAYEQYRDRVAVIALSVEQNDTDAVLKQYAESHGLTFAVGSDTGAGLGGIYVQGGIPTTLVIDRFGNIVFYTVGTQPSTGHFTRVFDALLGDGYTESTVLTGVPPKKADIPCADPAALAEALNPDGGIVFENPTSPTIWPMLPAELDGRSAVRSSNGGESDSSAEISFDVHAGEGCQLAFDFKTSTTQFYDLLTVSVDGQTVKVFCGEHDWTAWAVPLDPGQHRIRFAYAKSFAGSAGEDAVWLDNVRLLYGEEAAQAAADLPHSPVSDVFSVTIHGSSARQIVIEDSEDGIMAQYFASQSYWIIPDGDAEAIITLTSDIDPETAFAYVNYDDSIIPLTGAAAGDHYEVRSPVGTIDTIGYPYSNVYAYPSMDADISGIRGAMLFRDEESVNLLLVALMNQTGVSLTWHDAVGTPAP